MEAVELGEDVADSEMLWLLDLVEDAVAGEVRVPDSDCVTDAVGVPAGVTEIVGVGDAGSHALTMGGSTTPRKRELGPGTAMMEETPVPVTSRYSAPGVVAYSTKPAAPSARPAME